MSSVKILHNPRCSTSRKVLAMIQEKGIEPEIILYLKNPLTKSELQELIKKLDLPIRDMMRKKAPEYETIKDKKLTDEELIAEILKHPILIERPIVITERGARLCRLAEKVYEVLDV